MSKLSKTVQIIQIVQISQFAQIVQIVQISQFQVSWNIKLEIFSLDSHISQLLAFHWLHNRFAYLLTRIGNILGFYILAIGPGEALSTVHKSRFNKLFI